MIGSELIWYWADCKTLPFDHTHDLDLGVSRSESEIALSQEWGGRLTMNEKEVSHPFTTMILTCVTMVTWADVPNSDWGDFRRRRTVDISSCATVVRTIPQRCPYLIIVPLLRVPYLNIVHTSSLCHCHEYSGWCQMMFSNAFPVAKQVINH